MLVEKRGVHKPRLVLLALLAVLMVVQFGPLAPPAAADPPENRKHCPYPGAKEPQYLSDGTVVWWICIRDYARIGATTKTYEYWVWSYDHTEFPPATKADQVTKWKGYDDSPSYLMRLEAVVADGRGGGDFAGSVFIANHDGSNLDRRLAVHLQVQYKPTATSGWLTCHPGSWKESGGAWSWMKTSVAQWTEPDCGTGYYRSRVYGRFFSTSLNTWIRRGPIYSPSMFLNGPGTAPTEPTVTPAGPETDPG